MNNTGLNQHQYIISSQTKWLLHHFTWLLINPSNGVAKYCVIDVNSHKLIIGLQNWDASGMRVNTVCGCFSSDRLPSQCVLPVIVEKFIPYEVGGFPSQLIGLFLIYCACRLLKKKHSYVL